MGHISPTSTQLEKLSAIASTLGLDGETAFDKALEMLSSLTDGFDGLEQADPLTGLPEASVSLIMQGPPSMPLPQDADPDAWFAGEINRGLKDYETGNIVSNREILQIFAQHRK